MSDFLRRTLTAVWIVILILGGFWLHPLSFFITGLLILTGSLYEYYVLIRETGTRPQMTGGIAAGIILYSVSTLVSAGLLSELYFLVLIPVVLLIIVSELYRKQDKPFNSLAHTIFGLVYIGVPLSLFPFAAFSRTGISSLIPQNSLVFSPGLVIGFLLLLWLNDTGAYVTGITFGRHRIMERISPRKSWEGFIGGLVVAALTGWLISGWLGVLNPAGWIITAVIISVSGTFGDLVESMLKRSLGVKDSGSVMPGHGGFLDRFDSTFTSFPLVYLFISLFG
ncbi:MAG: phosphatidate cytidylyltransferase [Bacteroidota bacterium]|nr:phosphatidate cytidylyltransferase [Bacteroidota bacterium]